MNIFDITANKIRQVKDGAVNDIEDLYASKSDIRTVLDSKADQADTYTKEQINANFHDITETYDKTEINVLSNNISSNSFLIGNLTITSITNFINISSNTNLINTNFNNISLNTHLINNLNSTITSNFNNTSSNPNLIAGLNSTVNSHIAAILDLQNGGSFNEADYYNKITTNTLLSEKLDTSILKITLIHNITTTSIFKRANFGNYN